ncbi:hypothetical protein NHQ30_007599 [Ciborinia camelliae]|nr:hypothetical protein NHQ30_007599 [Ciborinia camelliae]
MQLRSGKTINAGNSSGALASLSSASSNATDQAPVYSSEGILKTFTIFKSLPRELQIMIWRRAVDSNPRNVPVEIMPHIGPGGFQFQNNIPIPECFLACKDYYEEAERRYSVLGHRLRANDMSLVQHVHPNLWLNPAIDRFCPVGHWDPQMFEVGLKLFFDVLQVSKIAVSDDTIELPTYNEYSWKTYFHKQRIDEWSPHIQDIFIYITTKKLDADAEPSFELRKDSFYFPAVFLNRRHWQHTEAAIRAFEKISRLNEKQHEEDEVAKMEGRPRVKAAKVPQWLFDFGDPWSVPHLQAMIEAGTLDRSHRPPGWFDRVLDDHFLDE